MFKIIHLIGDGISKEISNQSIKLLNNISKRTFFEKNQFKSVLINNANFYEDFFNEKK